MRNPGWAALPRCPKLAGGSTVEEILPHLYRTEVPLPQNPLRAVNSYVIRGEGRFLIIDTGMNRAECHEALSSGLTELKVDLRETDFFITHLHADHLGLVSELATERSKIYFNQPDAAIIGSAEAGQTHYGRAQLHGFPEAEFQKALMGHPGRRYSPKGPLAFHILRGGDRIDIGDYQFECVNTPGHTPGHMCLYEPRKRIFFAGDHILRDITPNISSWSDQENPLNDYLSSLDKVYGLDVELVLPGHREPFKDFRQRIRELKVHHRVRLQEVLAILEKGSQSAFEIASQMSWDMPGPWDLFPPSQKWFAVGEAIAHLRYLEEEGRVRRQMEGQQMVFSVS
jgi:glyoxylase-like metal-dependent hydrolase (beta-lactamase superfamily II)